MLNKMNPCYWGSLLLYKIEKWRNSTETIPPCPLHCQSLERKCNIIIPCNIEETQLNNSAYECHFLFASALRRHSFTCFFLHSSEHVFLLVPLHGKIFPHMTHIFSIFLLFSFLTGLISFAFSLYHLRDNFRSLSRIASCAQFLQ